MMGLEYGKRSVSASGREEGLVVPMACLNRVWCCGFYVGEGFGARGMRQGKGRVSLSASEENYGLDRQHRAQNVEPVQAKGSVRLSVGEEIQVVDRPFRAQNVEPVQRRGSVRLSVSKEDHAFGKHDLGP